MLTPQYHQPPGEPHLDFIRFLSARLDLEPTEALDALGTFLMTFEPRREQGQPRPQPQD